MQHKLATWAESDPNRRFDRLVRLIADREWLAEAARIVLASSGARTSGIDGIDKRRMQAGLDQHLADLRTSLLKGTIALSRSSESISRKRMASYDHWVYRP